MNVCVLFKIVYACKDSVASLYFTQLALSNDHKANSSGEVCRLTEI